MQAPCARTCVRKHAQQASQVAAHERERSITSFHCAAESVAAISANELQRLVWVAVCSNYVHKSNKQVASASVQEQQGMKVLSIALRDGIFHFEPNMVITIFISEATPPHQRRDGRRAALLRWCMAQSHMCDGVSMLSVLLQRSCVAVQLQPLLRL